MAHRSPPRHRRQSGQSEGLFLWIAVGALALGASALSIAGLFLPNDGSGTGTNAAPEPKTVNVELGDIFVKPSRISVESGTDLTLVVRNTGALDHDLKVGGKVGTAMLKKGRVETLRLGPTTSGFTMWCTVAGHKDGGMTLDVVVLGTGHGESAAAPPNATDGTEDATIDFAAAPGPDWKPYDPTLQPAPGGAEHAITLRATEKVIEVAPGVTQEMWTFDDMVPGPTLRAKVGDLITVTLVNAGKVDHSIDFHASKVAWNDEMRSIKPGEQLVYQYVAKHAGIYMYHCGTPPALHHIGNGMYGAIIVDPPSLARVDHEFVLVQSELYTGPMGKPGSMAKLTAERWDAVVFNGYVSQYLRKPIRVEPDQRVRVWVLDAGPSENSAFHIVGTIFDTVYKEGTYVLQPDGRQGGSQVLDLQPAQGGFVEFSFDEAGLYPIVTHKFANVGKGALGLFQAGEVASVPGAGH